MSTFGKTSNGGSSSNSSADRKRVSSASPSTSGTVTNGTCRCWVDSTGSSTARMVIYSDNAGQPDTLLAVSDDLSITNTSEQANNFTFSGANQIAITAGVTYWIGIHWSDPGVVNFNVSCDTTVNGNKNSADTFSDGTASSFGAVTNSTGVIDAFITYTEPSTDFLYPKILMF